MTAQQPPETPIPQEPRPTGPGQPGQVPPETPSPGQVPTETPPLSPDIDTPHPGGNPAPPPTSPVG